MPAPAAPPDAPAGVLRPAGPRAAVLAVTSAACAAALLGYVAVADPAEFDRFLRIGFVPPVVIAVALVVIARPERRLAGPAAPLGPGARVSTRREDRREPLVYALLYLALAAATLVLDGPPSVRAIGSVAAGHALAMGVVWLRLRRLARQSGAALYVGDPREGQGRALFAVAPPAGSADVAAAAFGRR